MVDLEVSRQCIVGHCLLLKHVATNDCTCKCRSILGHARLRLPSLLFPYLTCDLPLLSLLVRRSLAEFSVVGPIVVTVGLNCINPSSPSSHVDHLPRIGSWAMQAPNRFAICEYSSSKSSRRRLLLCAIRACAGTSYNSAQSAVTPPFACSNRAGACCVGMRTSV